MPVLFIVGIDLVVFIVAFAVLLLLLAGDKFLRIVSDVLKHIPFIGGYVAGVVSGWLEKAMQSFAAAFESYTVATAHFFQALGIGLWHFFYQLVTTIVDAKQWAVEAYRFAHSEAERVSAETTTEIQNLNHALTATINGAVAGVENDIGSVATAAGAGIAAAEALAHSLADQVSSEAVSLFGQAEAFTTTQVKTAEGLAQGLFDQVQSEAVTLFGQAEQAIQGLQQEVTALPGQIEGTIPGIVEGVVPGIIAGAIPGILSQVIPRVTTLETEVNQCLEPLCETVTPQAPRLGNILKLLQGLEDLAIEAAMVALAVEALHDPAAVVTDISTVVHDVGDPVMAGFRDLIGA